LSHAYQVVRDFEKSWEEYSGAPHAISVDSCTNAIFLCLVHFMDIPNKITIPKRTYPSIANAVIHAGLSIEFSEDEDWQKKGWYKLGSSNIYDSAKYFERGMCGQFGSNYYVCLSFHLKKRNAHRTWWNDFD